MRLPNVKILLCRPSRMHIYGFVQNRTFLKQFLSMGVPAEISNLGVPAQFSNLGVPAQFSNLGGTSTKRTPKTDPKIRHPKNGPQNSSPKTLALCVGRRFHATAPQTSIGQSRRGWWREIPMV